MRAKAQNSARTNARNQAQNWGNSHCAGLQAQNWVRNIAKRSSGTESGLLFLSTCSTAMSISRMSSPRSPCAIVALSTNPWGATHLHSEIHGATSRARALRQKNNQIVKGRKNLHTLPVFSLWWSTVLIWTVCLSFPSSWKWKAFTWFFKFLK